jgi:hypothetical protein
METIPDMEEKGTAEVVEQTRQEGTLEGSTEGAQEYPEPIPREEDDSDEECESDNEEEPKSHKKEETPVTQVQRNARMKEGFAKPKRFVATTVTAREAKR